MPRSADPACRTCRFPFMEVLWYGRRARPDADECVLCAMQQGATPDAPMNAMDAETYFTQVDEGAR